MPFLFLCGSRLLETRRCPFLSLFLLKSKGSKLKSLHLFGLSLQYRSTTVLNSSLATSTTSQSKESISPSDFCVIQVQISNLQWPEVQLRLTLSDLPLRILLSPFASSKFPAPASCFPFSIPLLSSVRRK